MVLFGAAVVLVAGGSAYLGYALFQHERRPLKIGSVAANDEQIKHPSWNAIVDNYVYIHNAFRNHLTFIRMKCEKGRDVIKDLQRFKEILDLHSRVEDEIFIPALQTRLEAKGSTKLIPEEIMTGKDHEGCKELIRDVLSINADNDVLVQKLKQLETELDKHLVNEETNVMPLMLEAFSTRELWALDSFIVNPKLGFCDKDMLMTVTKWWFGNLSIKEGWPLLQNFIRAGKQPAMPLEEWKKLQDTIPELQKFPTEDLVS